MSSPLVVRTRSSARGEPSRDAASIVTDPDLIAGYLEDASGRTDGRAVALARPDSHAGVVAALGEAARREWAVLPQAGRSSLTGGAIPADGLVLSVERLDGIDAIRRSGAGATVRAGAGVRLDRLADHVERQGWFFPPIPTYRQAMLGGTVSTNAGGPLGFKYGPTRGWVRGLTVVLASGETIELERGAQLVPRGESFVVESSSGRRVRVATPQHQLPALRKLSAGYHAADPLDLVDLFVGAEGTLGVITEVTLALAVRPAAVLAAWIFGGERCDVRRLASTLRESAARRPVDPTAPDVRAIEWIDRAGVARLRAADAARHSGLPMPADTREALYVELELPEATGEQAVLGVLERCWGAQRTDPRETVPALVERVLERWFGLLDAHGALERLELVCDDRPRRFAAFAALREALPVAINEELALGSAGRPPRRKSGGDLIVPFERVWELADRCRTEIEARRLDGAVWGHVADGNLHPNVVPRDAGEAAAADELQLQLGQLATELGGAPLAEHGVGRHPVKQRLLEAFVGRRAISRMRRIKHALDPAWRLAPGVLFDAAPPGDTSDPRGRV